jgi:hypothetical protein
MNIGEHTTFMINFISDFINGELDRYFFDLDYPAYVIEHFPYMELENSRLAGSPILWTGHTNAELLLASQMKSSGLKCPTLLTNGWAV